MRVGTKEGPDGWVSSDGSGIGDTRGMLFEQARINIERAYSSREKSAKGMKQHSCDSWVHGYVRILTISLQVPESRGHYTPIGFRDLLLRRRVQALTCYFITRGQYPRFVFGGSL